MAIDFTLTPELEQLRLQVRDFIDTVVKPGESKIGNPDEIERGEYIQILLSMRADARAAGLWLPHMPKEWGGMGLGHVALAMVQAEAAKTYYGPWVLNCQAPDEGNMHTLLHWGTDEQKEKYLRPLCDGVAMSCFAMTEPEVAGSDPTLIQTRAVRHGDDWVINGHKWFISNARRASFAILIARTEDTPRCRKRPTRASSSTFRRPGGRACARSRPCTVPAVIPRSASRTCACRPRTCSAAAARDIASVSTASDLRAWRTACAGSPRPRPHST